MNTSPPPRLPRVIVADDHEWILQILVQVVQQTLPHAEIVAVENGRQALLAYETQKADFVVSNHMMPEMDGPTLVRHLREVAPDLPILMVSVKPESRADAMEAGANWFLSKPQITEQMPGLLRDHLGSKAGFPPPDPDYPGGMLAVA